MKSFIFNALVWLNRPTIQSVIVGLALIFVITVSDALELIIADDPQCSYCNQFRADIDYDQSPHAEWAPAVFITYSIGYHQSRDEWPNWFGAAMDEGRIDPIGGTPTFIFYATPKGETDPVEIGRIIGYGGAEWFNATMEKYRAAYNEWKVLQEGM